MVEIIKLSSIDKAIITTVENSIIKSRFDLDIPNSFGCSTDWFLNFSCKCCGANVTYENWYKSETIVAASELIYSKMHSKDFLNSLGKVFNLEVHDEIDANREIVYYYYYPYKGTLPSWVTYFKCFSCHQQYLLCYSITYAAERSGDVDMVYVVGVLQVSFDESLFLELFKKYNKK